MLFTRKPITVDSISAAELAVLATQNLTTEIDVTEVANDLYKKGLLDENNVPTESAKKFLIGGRHPISPYALPRDWKAYGKIHTKLLYTLCRYILSLLAKKDVNGYEKLMEEFSSVTTSQAAEIHISMNKD